MTVGGREPATSMSPVQRSADLATQVDINRVLTRSWNMQIEL